MFMHKTHQCTRVTRTHLDANTVRVVMAHRPVSWPASGTDGMTTACN